MTTQAFNHDLLRMSWKSSDNVTDCAIYCMRHLETFKGVGPNWVSGFNKTSANVSTVIFILLCYWEWAYILISIMFE